MPNPMDLSIARAFLNMQLLPAQRVQLRAYERSGTLPPNRLLTASEICRWQRIQPTAVSEEAMEAMRTMRRQYERDILRRKRNTLNQSAAEEQHEWEDWALIHFGDVDAAA